MSLWHSNNNNVDAYDGEWWMAGDSALYAQQPYPQPPYASDNNFHLAPMDPTYGFPSQDSPLFSPQLPYGSTSYLGADESAYWGVHPDGRVYPGGDALQSPQYSDLGLHAADLWSGFTDCAGFPSQSHSSYAGPSSSPFDTGSPLAHILPLARTRKRASSPTSASDSSGRLSPLGSGFTSSSAASSRRGSVDSTAGSTSSSSSAGASPAGPTAMVKRCSHCAATTTPLWRRNPATRQPLCNACGLYLQQRNKLRPLALIAADHEDEELALHPPADDDDDFVGPECSHCRARKTSVWRRSKTGAKLCNACGVYARLRGRDRPLTLRKNTIKPRCKHAK